MSAAAKKDQRDPKVQTEEYIEKHKIRELFEAMTAYLIYYKPTEPRLYLIELLQRMKTQGIGTPLISAKDLDTMFHMFDITNKGTVTVQQATEALRTILGPTAQLDPPFNQDPQRLLTKTQFVEVMEKQLASAAPKLR